MTKTFCDICGEELTPDNTVQLHARAENTVDTMPNILYAAQVHDPCKQCAEVGAEINVVATMRRFWQEQLTQHKMKDTIEHYKEVKEAHGKL